MEVMVLLVILITSHFHLLIPLDNIIFVCWAYVSRTWNIISHSPMVYDNSRRPLEILTLDDVAPLNTSWKKTEDKWCGADGAINIHAL